MLEIILDARAAKEIKKFPKVVRIKIQAYLEILEENGVLSAPIAKKIKTKPALYEIRIKYRGAWRVFYSYLDKNQAIILSALNKKTRKTPIKEIKK